MPVSQESETMRVCPAMTRSCADVHRGNTAPPCGAKVYTPGARVTVKVPDALLRTSETAPVEDVICIAVAYGLGAHRSSGGFCSTGHVGPSVTVPVTVPVAP